MELNERITQARKHAGMTQEQLGEALGVSRQAVSKWESGQANPDVTYIMKMCRIFEVSADWLLFGAEQTPPVQGQPAIPKGKTEHGYTLYLTKNFDHDAAFLLPMLFSYPWATPAFPWVGGEMTVNDANTIIEAAPLVLCEGLTREQAREGAQLFQNYPGSVEIYEDLNMVNGVPTPKPGREPLSGIAIFGLVVLGVIAAILVMSFL